MGTTLGHGDLVVHSQLDTSNSAIETGIVVVVQDSLPILSRQAFFYLTKGSPTLKGVSLARFPAFR